MSSVPGGRARKARPGSGPICAMAAAAVFGMATGAVAADPASNAKAQFLSHPIVRSIFTADPSAHVFDGKIYVYPSHDIPTTQPDDDLGSEYAMRDYRVLWADNIDGPYRIGPVALDEKDVPWVSKQMWAPDAAYKDGTYFLYFPARDAHDVFHIGVATSKNPLGPFKAQPRPIRGSYSIDPAVFTDDNGVSYMYFGGIWGGQLQQWASGTFDPTGSKTDLHQDQRPEIAPRVARMSGDMLEFAEKPREILILDQAGKPILAGDHDRRFFEASWMNKHGGKYYLSYSTGDTHFMNYAIGDSPYGPFTYKGHILLPVQGWTTHGSIVDFKGQSYLFYADNEMSGKNSLRNVKVTPLHYNPDGTIQTIDPMVRR